MSNYLEQINALSANFSGATEDQETPITINVFTRNCVFGEKFNKQIAVEKDTNANIITFKCNRYIEGYDVSATRDAYITWNNKNAKTFGTYKIINRTLLEDEENFVFSWQIREEITESAGPITFAINFVDYATNLDEEVQVISYRWNSNPCSELYVGTGLPNYVLESVEYIEEIEDTTNKEAVIAFALTDNDSAVSFSMFNRNFIFDNNMNKQVAVTGDCSSSIITFNIDPAQCDYDISKADLAMVKWKIGNISDYNLLIQNTEIEGQFQYFWIIPPELTVEKGQITFALLFITADEEGKIISRWNSNPCSVLNVGQGLYNEFLDEMENINIFRNEYNTISQSELNRVFQEVFNL